MAEPAVRQLPNSGKKNLITGREEGRKAPRERVLRSRIAHITEFSSATHTYIQQVVKVSVVCPNSCSHHVTWTAWGGGSRYGNKYPACSILNL